MGQKILFSCSNKTAAEETRRTATAKHATNDKKKKITQTFIERSGLEANEVAKEILIRAGNKELYIILPKAARTMWKLKRLAPTWFRLKVKDQFMNAMNKALSRKS